MLKLLLNIRIYFFVLMLILVHQQTKAQLTYNELSVQYDSPWTFKKLQLIPIRFKDKGGAEGFQNITAFDNQVISFSDALKQHKIVIKENTADGGADVTTLLVKNRSKDNVLLMSGEMVQGGKQDRAFGKTTIIPAGRNKNYLPVFCIEKGRWDDKSRPFKHAGTADARVRKQIDETQRQSKIWKQIDAELAEKNKKNQTSAYLKAYNDSSLDDTSYLHYFINKMRESDSSYAGFIAITSDRIINSEIFSGSDLCLAAYIEMIKSYVHSILPNDGVPVKKHDEIKAFTDKFLPDKTIQKKYLTTNGRMYYYNGEIIHLVAYDSTNP
ncbi:MAG TPA: DUF6569 family protein [Parafilimonas sp.]|nr:DUF6569 family protein [Parafilimonas sp.]